MPEVDTAVQITTGIITLSTVWAAVEMGVGWLIAAARSPMSGEGDA